MLSFNTENMVQQEFPFPAPIMDYIFKNVSASHLLKLYKTCKFFYDKYRLNIIEDLEIRGCQIYQRIVGNSLAIYHGNPAFANLRNLWISKSFTFCDHYRDRDEIDFEMFSRLTFDKFYIIGPYRLREYEFLVKPPTLRHLFVRGRIYRSTKTDCLSIEEIIERVPHVSTIDLSLFGNGMTPPLDMTKLLSLERQTKLTSFHLENVSHIPDSLQVVEFFIKHGTPDIDYYFGFTNNNADDIKAFYKTIDAELQAWKHSLLLPPTVSSSFIDLTGKTAVITGASEGIGRATVILFRQLGASVIAVARNGFQLKSLIEECQNISNAGFLHTVSLDTNNTNELFKITNYKFGTKFDVLVNIVDTSGWYSIPNIEYEQRYYHDLYYILQYHYYLIKEATPYLKETKGCVINVSNGMITNRGKAASVLRLKNIINNFESILASSGVRINTVNPGALSTVLTRPDVMNDADYETYLQETKKSREEQSAKAIAFLACDAAKLIVGSTFPQL